MSRLAIGTAQFGLDYGVTNQFGRVPPQDVTAIIGLAKLNSIDVFDTAPAYGDAQSQLSMGLRNCKYESNARIVTKIPPKLSSPTELAGLFDQSLKLLNCQSVYGCLFHSADSLLGENGDQLWKALQQEQIHGRVKRIGVSVYTVAQLNAVRNRFNIDLVQLPYNVFNQSFSADLPSLKRDGVEIHARSIFLQGLLLASPHELPSYFRDYQENFVKFHQLLDEQKISPLDFCLRHALECSELDNIVVGVTSSHELLQIIQASTTHSDNLQKKAAHLAVNLEQLTNPSMWKL